MNKKQMSEQIQREIAEYRTLTSEEKKEAFWQRIYASDAQLSERDRSLINEVVYDDLQALIAQTKNLLERVKLVKPKS